MPAGLVIVNWSRHALVEADDGRRVDCLVRGRKLAPVCGDRVDYEVGAEGAVIERIHPRRSTLERHDPRRGAQPLAANLDRMLVVCAAVPACEPFLIDKYFVAAHALGIDAGLVLNKADLLDDGVADEEDAHPLRALVAEYAALGYPTVEVSTETGAGAEAFRAALAGRVSVLVGASGVGKSSLVALAVPDHDVRVGEISAATGEGRHTTTHTMLFHVPSGGALIDSPGVRDFMLWPMPVGELRRHFVEFAPFAARCKFADCTHLREPGCAVRAAVDEDAILLRRWDAYAGLARIMQEQYVSWER
jgi:ribosome biogenesis GTPase